MKKIKIIKLKSFKKKSGKLIPITFDNKFPIKIKRFFYIFGKKNQSRGHHAHKKCYQFFIPISGKIELLTTTNNVKKKIVLGPNKNKAILVPNLVWCSLKFLTKNSIVLVVCNRVYEFNDYIESYDDFRKFEKIK